MKSIYLKIMDLLKEVNQINFIDRDRGQLERWGGERPPVKFPCALVKISLPRIKNLAPDMQLIECSVTVRIGFDYTGDVSTVSSQARIDNALKYYETVEAVVRKLQGFGDKEMNRMERTSQIDEDRADGLNVIRIGFLTGYQEIIAS